MPVSAASFLRNLRAPVAGVPPGASAAGAGGCDDHGSAGGLAGGTSVEAALSGKAGDWAAPKGSAGGLLGVSIQGSDAADGVAQGSGSVGLAGLMGSAGGSAGGAAMLGLPGAAATKGSAGAEAPAQGSSELSATSTIAPSRLLLAGWAAPVGGRVDGVWQPRDWVMPPAKRLSRSGCGRVPYKLPKGLAACSALI